MDDESMEAVSYTYRLNKPEPMKEETALKHTDEAFIAEPKYDGDRCLLFKQDGLVTLLSHRGNCKNEQFPEIMENAESLPDNTVLDGELCILESAYKSSLAKLQKRFQLQNKLKINLLSRQTPATFMAFDILRLNDIDVSDKTLSMRKTLLGNIKVERIRKVEHFLPKDMHQRVLEENLEGMVIKSLAGPYSTKWYKWKNRIEHDFRVIGYTSERRKVSALELEDSDGNYVGKVNYNPARFSMEDSFISKLKGMTAVVEYLKPGTSDKLRDPVLLDLRN